MTASALYPATQTGDTALRFGDWFGIEPQFWLNLQSGFDLAAAKRLSGAGVRELPVAAASNPLSAPV